MKTTIDIDDTLLPRVKQRAANRGMTLKAYIEESLRSSLLMHQSTEDNYVFDLPVVHGVRRPDIDVSDRDQLYDIMTNSIR